MSHEGDKSDNSNSVGASRRPNLELQAIMGEMRRMLRTELGTVHERIDRLQESVQAQTEAPLALVTRGTVVRARRDRRHKRVEEEENYYSEGSRVSNRTNRRPRRDQEARRRDDNLNGLKLKIPPFYGKNDPDAYLEWEKKIELVFDCQPYSEHKKVQVAATEFYEYAINWWDQLVTNRRRNEEPRVETWEEMKTLMRKRFVPSHFHRELHQKLRRLSQGSKGVEDYFQEMETLMIKADVDEDMEATMARFLGGLS